MTEDSLKEFYKKDYRPIYVGNSQAPDAFFRNQIEHGRKVYDYIISDIETESKKPLKVFDVGCGAGGNLLHFKENGWIPFGCDLGEEYLNRGREEGLILEHGDAMSLSQYGPANVVILSHVLEHLPRPLENLNEISKLLIDDGYIYVEVPGIFNIHNAYGDVLLFLQNAHLYHFTLSTLSSLMAQAGFELIKGDEKICALFRKKNAVEIPVDEKEHARVQHYLYQINKYRRVHIYKLYIRKCVMLPISGSSLLLHYVHNHLRKKSRWLYSEE